MNQKNIYLFFAVVFFVGLTGYYFNAKYLDNKEKVQDAEESQTSEISNTISIVYVDNDAVKQIKRIQPTADYIAAKLSTNESKYIGKVVVVKNFENVTELLKEQKVDLYIDSPFTASLVSKKSGSVPFLRRWKDGVDKYHSIFIVKNGSSIKTLDDFVGKTIAFEDPGSTSAYLLPKAYLVQKGFNLSQSYGKNNIRYVFSGGDENTPMWVVEGKADIGAVSNLDFEKYQESLKDKLKIIDRTIDVPRHVVSYRSGLDPSIVERIKQILLNMDKDPDGIEILKDFQNTRKYDEISRDDIFNASKMLDLLDQ